MISKKGLGTGLGALFGDDVLETETQTGWANVPISKVEPRKDQPRERFDDEALEELAESIAEHGVLQPITVRPIKNGRYQIIAGERRWRASRIAKLAEVPVRIIDADDQKAQELALIENLQREDLNPLEEARGYQQLINKFGLTQEQTAAGVGKSRPVVANALRLLTLPEKVQKLVEESKLSLSHARLLLELDAPEKQIETAEIAVNQQLTVRAMEALIKRSTQPKKKKTREFSDGVDYTAEVERDLSKMLGRKVHIEDGKKKGSIQIEYYGRDDFENVRKALMKLRLGSGE